MNLFEIVKYGVSCREAAELYGMEVNRYGMAFINAHGCERYFAHNEDLLFYERGADLADRINRLDLTEDEA